MDIQKTVIYMTILPWKKNKANLWVEEYVCLLFKNLDSQMKQKTVWGIVVFLHSLVFYIDGGKKKIF